MIVAVPLFRVFPVENVFEIKTFITWLEKKKKVYTLNEFTFVSVDKITNKYYDVTRVKIMYTDNIKPLGV